MTRRKPRPLRRLRNAALVSVTVAGLVAANGPVVAAAVDDAYTDFQRSRPEYQARYGDWQTIELPERYRGQAIHAALLHTGDVLLIAGSGNEAEDFDAGTFRTVVWDPVTGEAREVPTPEDLFCSGHAYLPNGNLLVAGGTRKYEVLADDVTRAAGILTVKNERLDETVTLPTGTRFTARGLTYVTTAEVTVPPAHTMADGTHMAGQQDVWIEAEDAGDQYVVTEGQQFQVTEFDARQRATLYGQGDTITLDKQNYRGLDASYEFDVATETYRRTGRLTESRWYPTLVGLDGGRVLAVSGLDEHGKVLDGQNEVYDPATRTWAAAPELERYFPTYPGLHRLADGSRVFYSGANTGYGPAEEGRQPGIWDLEDNSWTDVDGLRDPDFNETASSFLLAPAQDQRVGIVGGGGVGDSEESTARFDVVDLDEPQPRYRPAGEYPSPARYVNAVTLPDDTTLLTGGSRGYRGNSQSDLFLATLYDPQTGHLHQAAPNEVGRNYHATALLLPDGRVMTMGSDPLFSDAENTLPGRFETRIELYSPPYLFAGDRPAIADAPQEVVRGGSFTVATTGADVAEARLLRPSAVTHQTDPEQRSVALDVRSGQEGGHELTVPAEEGLVPSGWYMLVVLDDDGVPSPARWVHVA
ncbi:galactose oxidase early set domain-containing protein [Geodermatophilus sp. DSM 44513]|uniref:galactose oxidase early set domain-containing protein n=1 Tax=Geodermatophilus sp. DSM 44513 TaxID=1528104 RepID=UPI00128A8023|nr:galactose oxidase early set domain-containing protein [Geodermatophilus sp. DSM 44513]WNV76656.1 galactose oxidase early set domain-containing protein [Geodermatophilus sp. DSM 44513]